MASEGQRDGVVLVIVVIIIIIKMLGSVLCYLPFRGRRKRAQSNCSLMQINASESTPTRPHPGPNVTGSL